MTLTSFLFPEPIEARPKINPVSGIEVKEAIRIITEFPKALEAAINGLSPDDLLWSYRVGGWSIAQIVNHLADSHLNAYIRFKLGVTEPGKTITTYAENEWAATQDGASADLEASMLILKGLHTRWAMFVASLSDEQLDLTFVHPVNGVTPIRQSCMLYSWHALHHLAQIEKAKVERIIW